MALTRPPASGSTRNKVWSLIIALAPSRLARLAKAAPILQSTARRGIVATRIAACHYLFFRRGGVMAGLKELVGPFFDLTEKYIGIKIDPFWGEVVVGL